MSYSQQRPVHIGGSRKPALDTISLVIVVVVFALFMFPFIMVLLNSLKGKVDIIRNPFGFTLSASQAAKNYKRAFSTMNYIRSFCNSLFVTGLSTVAVIFLSSMLAYYLVRHVNKFSMVVNLMIIASMIIPFQSLMIPLVSIYGSSLHLLNHRLTLIFMHTGFSIALSTFTFQGFIKSDCPVALEEAATIDGCGHYRTFFSIVFPLLKPVTFTIVILNVLQFWNDYLLPSLVLAKKEILTLPLTTYVFYGTYSAEYGVIMAALILTVVPILILYLALQRQIIAGVISGAVK